MKLPIRLLPLLFFCIPFAALASPSPAKLPQYLLSLSFLPEKAQLLATVKLSIPGGREMSLSTSGLQLTGLMLQDEGGSEHGLTPVDDLLILPAAKTARTLYISYIFLATQDPSNLISEDGISLTRAWFPIPRQPVIFSLQAELPTGFTAITESDIFPLAQQGRQITSSFKRPATHINFIAGPYQHQELAVRDGLKVHSLFFAEDKGLASTYLQAAKEHITRFEKELGSFPYNHYVIVANRRPTGYGMPTFTLLGQQVLRLPFIAGTSLGHEIVHSWFGNAVEVDYEKGNWAEGLTTYLTDHQFRADKGEGAAVRKEAIVNYLSYTGKDKTIPLKSFRSASHNQPLAKSVRAVGYNRGAMLFHELEDLIGREQLMAGLRRFYHEGAGRQAGWPLLEKSIEEEAKRDLTAFFSERLNRIDIPDLEVKDMELTSKDGLPELSFTLIQRGEKPYTLNLPIDVLTLAGKESFVAEVFEASQRITLPLKATPTEFILDPNLVILRKLSQDEMPASLSRFLGSSKKLAVIKDPSQQQLYQELLTALGGAELPVVNLEELTTKDLIDHDLLFAGLDQEPVRIFFAGGKELQERGNGVSLRVHDHPLSPGSVAVLLHASSSAETLSVAAKLRHYGKYQDLFFRDARKILAETEPGDFGMRYRLEPLADGIATAKLDSFATIVAELAQKQVVYIGETHTSMADHRLQLQLIEALRLQDRDLAIGLEMFPKSSQQALDDYIQGRIDEREFIKSSKYYQVWRFDYRLYRDIFRYARAMKIPLIGLNLEREIAAEVFQKGGSLELEESLRKSLPQKRDLTLPGYRENLAKSLQMHQSHGHAEGSLAGFIEAQALWDESMAANIADFLRKNPGKKMIVLAGSQHTRKDLGIPPRMARRLTVKQASVAGISTSYAMEDARKRFDFLFFVKERPLPERAIIGVILDDSDPDGLKLIDFSPHGKAKEAGLQKGDILVSIDGIAITEMADIKLALMDFSPGDQIELGLRRGTGDKTQEILLPVLLSAPPMMDKPAAHP